MRWICLIFAVGSAFAAAAGAAAPAAVFGTIASKAPITIGGAEMSPTAAPSWPLTAEDEFSNSAPAMLRTATHDVFTFDSESRARVGTVESGRPYLYLRQGGVHFNAKEGLLYICMAGHLFVPEKAAEGSLTLDAAGKIVLRVEHGQFAEQGARSCMATAPPNFLSTLPAVAGGALAGVAGASAAGAGAAAGAAGAVAGAGAAAGGIGAATLATVVGTGVAAAAGASSAASATSTCSSQAGCNFNPSSISPSTP